MKNKKENEIISFFVELWQGHHKFFSLLPSLTSFSLSILFYSKSFPHGKKYGYQLFKNHILQT